MWLWVFLGFIFLGVLSICLGLFQGPGRQSSSAPSFKRPNRPIARTDSMPGNHLLKTSLLSKQASLGISSRKGSAGRVKRVKGPLPKKLVGDHRQTKNVRQENLADEQWRINPSQKVNSDFKQTYRRGSRRPKAADGYPESSSSQPINPGFEETQIRRSRQPKPVNSEAKAYPPQSANVADEQTQMRSSRRAKPKNHSET